MGDYTVFTTSALRNSYMARRLRNRNRLEQFHAVELLTSRPSLHDMWLARRRPDGQFVNLDSSALASGPLLGDSSARSQVRRDQPRWRHELVPKILEIPGFSDEHIAKMK